MTVKASRRVAQFNLLFTPSELRELKRRAIKETGGNISELIRRAVFPRTVEQVGDELEKQAREWVLTHQSELKQMSDEFLKQAEQKQEANHV